MYSDPSGHFVLSAFLVSLAIGAAIGFAAAYVPDVIENAEDGFDWNDLNTFENNWEKYIVSTLNGLVTGAVFGLGAGLGISAFNMGVKIATSTALLGFGAATAGSFASGMGIYALETKVFKSQEYNEADLWKSGVAMGLEGALNFGFGLLLGNQGFYNVKNGLIQRTYLKQTLMTPINEIIQSLLESMW